jgi:ribosome-binding ATPase YchF (GTP1/OBG family)
VRGFDAPQVYHPAGTVDPERDRAALDAEAMLADMERIEKRLTRIAKEKRNANTPEQAVEEATLRKCMHTLEANTRLRDAGLQPFELRAIRSLEFLTLLPSLCAYNVSEPDAARRFAPPSVTVSALIEQEIMAIEDPADRAEYLRSMGLSESGLDRMNAAAHDAMGLMCFYTIGPDEARAWPIRKGTAAPEAGGKIHTDIQRGFIRVEIIKYDDLVAAGSESAARAAGKVQAKGRDYIIEDGDICHFLFSV